MSLRWDFVLLAEIIVLLFILYIWRASKLRCSNTFHWKFRTGGSIYSRTKRFYLDLKSMPWDFLRQTGSISTCFQRTWGSIEFRICPHRSKTWPGHNLDLPWLWLQRTWIDSCSDRFETLASVPKEFLWSWYQGLEAWFPLDFRDFLLTWPWRRLDWEFRMLSRLKSAHGQWISSADTVVGQRSTFSHKLTSLKCSNERHRKFFLPTTIWLYNASTSLSHTQVATDPVNC